MTVFIDTVTIKKDGQFNKVVFSKSGKVWYCINHDMIYDENYSNDSTLSKRSNHNFFTYYDEYDEFMSITTPKEYTDEEIKLLYAIDPYGVANYVQRYASEQFACDGLQGVLCYKDYIFELLFKRKPKYFARTIDGSTWYETTDKSNLSAVQSESESVFGMHPIWDDYTLLQIIEAAGTIVSIAITITCTAPKVAKFLEANKNIENIVKFFSFLSSSVGSGFISASVDEFVEKAFKDTALSWAYAMVSLFDNLYELVSDFDVGDNYYKQIFEHCTNDLNYNIYVELKSGGKYKLEEISEMITHN